MSVDVVLSWLRGHTISAGEFSYRTLARSKYTVWRTEESKEDTHSGKMWEMRGMWNPRVCSENREHQR
jgi:hypothetical protein